VQESRNAEFSFQSLEIQKLSIALIGEGHVGIKAESISRSMEIRVQKSEMEMLSGQCFLKLIFRDGDGVAATSRAAL